jgi:hypothetical protein
MIVKTDFRDGSAGDLVQYIQRDRSQDAVNTVDLRNPSGRELGDTEVDRFVNKSRDLDFQRHLIVSPDPTGQYTPDEVSEHTQELMNREVGQQATTNYVYAVHRDTEFPHAHVAVTGQESELRMDREEIDRLRERASEIYNEPERTQQASPTGDEQAARTPSQPVPAETREELHERELAMQEHPEKEVLRETERAEERTPSEPQSETERDENRIETLQQRSENQREADPVPEPDREPAADPELEPEPGRDREPEPEPEQEPEPEVEREQDWMMGG